MIALGLLALLLGLACAYDLRDGEVPLLLLVSISALGALHTMGSMKPPEWTWRAAAAIAMMTGAGLVGRLSVRLRRWIKPEAKPAPIGLGAADLLLIGGAACWLDPESPALFGMFLALSGIMGILWAMIRHGISNAGGAVSREGLPMIPAVSFALFILLLID